MLPARTDLRMVDPPELLILTTKSYDTAGAVEQCRPWAGDDLMVLTLQNGLWNFEQLRAWKRLDAFGGTTTMGATLVAPGRVRIAGLGRTLIGSEDNPEGALHIIRAFASCGIPAEHSHDIEAEIWGKVIISSCINPLTAILRVPNGKLLKSETLVRLMREISREGVSVARSMGVILPARNMHARARSVARDTSANFSSMLQDVMKNKRTEIFQINGAISDLARRQGIEAPLNRALTAMVQALEPAVRRGTQKG